MLGSDYQQGKDQKVGEMIKQDTISSKLLRP